MTQMCDIAQGKVDSLLCPWCDLWRFVEPAKAKGENLASDLRESCHGSRPLSPFRARHASAEAVPRAAVSGSGDQASAAKCVDVTTTVGAELRTLDSGRWDVARIICERIDVVEKV
jgi:hypothetical protein